MAITTKAQLFEASGLAREIQRLISALNRAQTIGAKTFIRTSNDTGTTGGTTDIDVPTSQVATFLSNRIEVLKTELLTDYEVDFDACRLEG